MLEDTKVIRPNKKELFVPESLAGLNGKFIGRPKSAKGLSPTRLGFYLRIPKLIETLVDCGKLLNNALGAYSDFDKKYVFTPCAEKGIVTVYGDSLTLLYAIQLTHDSDKPRFIHFRGYCNMRPDPLIEELISSAITRHLVEFYKK